MKKIIHINRNIIQYNAKHNTALPVCRVLENMKVKYGAEVDIHGPSKMVYRPEKPQPCGAKLWIETTADITIKDECTFKDIQQMKKELL